MSEIKPANNRPAGHPYETYEFGQFSLSWEVWRTKPMTAEPLTYPLVHCNLFINDQPLDACWLGRLGDTPAPVGEWEEDPEYLCAFELSLPPPPSRNAYIARGMLRLLYVNETDPRLTIDVVYGPLKKTTHEVVVLIDPPGSSSSSSSSGESSASSFSSSDFSSSFSSSALPSSSGGLSSTNSSGSSSDEKKKVKAGRRTRTKSSQAGR